MGDPRDAAAADEYFRYFHPSPIIKRVNTKGYLPAERTFQRYDARWEAGISHSRQLDLLVLLSFTRRSGES